MASSFLVGRDSQDLVEVMQDATSKGGRARAQVLCMQEVRPEGPHAGRLDARSRGAPPLLGQASRRHDGQERVVTVDHGPDLGDLVVMLLASTLAGLADRLAADGFAVAADLVTELVEVVDGYLVAVRG